MNEPVRHDLWSARPLPGATPADGRWRLSWTGTKVMGVVNVTPDSFSDGGRFAAAEAAVAAGRSLTDEGAWFVDVGGESTRPGATPVPEEEERRRILPVIEGLAAGGEVRISVDTRHPRVARDALAAGAHLVNDVGGLRDPAMRAVCAEAGAPALAMHMQGEPSTMQDDPRYGDVVAEVCAFLRDRLEEARADGVPSVMVDPGIGFGKTVAHNLALLRSLERVVALGAPVAVGASRKGLLGTLTGEPRAARRDAASIAVHLDAARRGAALVRAHDVAGHVQALAAAAGLRGDAAAAA